MRLVLFFSAVLLAATAVAQGTTSTDKDLTPTDVLAQLPDFPKHWNQAHLYNQVIRDEYGNGAPAGCVAVAGAACMDWFHYPAQFGEKKYNATGRELRTEPLDWARLAPEPLDARGRRTAQTILYNLGLLTQIHYVQGGSSTTPLVYLAAALKDPSVNYASAYFVDFGSGATDADVETAIWASLRCGSPVAMSIERDGGAHAVVATGCGTDANGNPLTQVFGGYGSNPTWMDVPTNMPIPGGYTYSRLASVVTGIVPTAPKGISGAALPVLGTVVDKNGRPIPFAKVSLSINGAQVAETATDLQGRYGLWGWFGYDMTIQASIYTSSTKTVPFDPITLPAQRHNGTTDYPLPGMPALRVKVGDLRAAIEACKRKLTIDTDLSDSAIIHTDLESAKTAAQANATKGILCLNSEDPDLKAAFRRFDDYTLLYADPRLPAPFPEVDSLPDVRLFRLDASGAITDYSTTATSDKFTGSLDENLITHYLKDSENIIDPSWNADNAHVKNTSDATVTGDVRIATLTVGRPVIFKGEGTITWANLEQNDAITLDGPNFRYIPPMVEGENTGKTSAFPGDFTVQNGAELYFGNGDVSGYQLSEGTITIGPGGILCVASRDTLNRTLVLAGGEVHLGDKGGNFGSLDLFSTTIKVTDDSSVSGLSGANNPQLMAREGETTIILSNDAKLIVSVPITTDDKSSLIIRGAYNEGPGTVALNTVSAPTTVRSGVLLEGGTFTGGLTLADGARLTTDAPITVTGDFSASGTITIEGDFSGLIVKGVTKIPEGVTFTTPENFSVVAAEDGLRLVAKFATAPVWYADGVRMEGKPTDATAANSLLVLTTTDRKESGLWEGYAAFRSSPAGGGWNVCIAANGNIPENQTASDYIQSADCKYVLIGASASATEIPALAGSLDRLDGFHVGRLPLRESISMGTVEDLGSLGNGAKQTYADRIDAELIEAYVAKLRKAGDKHACGKLSLLGGGYGVPNPYKNDTDFTQWDGLPSIEDAEAWTKPTSRGLTVYALRDRYRLFKVAEPDVFPDLTLYDDVTIPRGTAPNGLAYGRGIIGKTDGALLWVEDKGRRNRLSTICVNGTDNGTVTAEAIPGLYSLVVTPSGQSGDFSQADSPSVGEMLVLNPQGGALTVFAPTGTDATLTVSDTGIPSSATHTVCATVAENLIADPTLTVGQAFSQALKANPNLTTTLTLLGDPTVRVMAWPEPEANPILPEGEEEVQLSEATLQALREAAIEGGLPGDFHVAVRSVDGKTKRPLSELNDALACFEGLKPTVENDDKVVVAYDFGVTRLHIEGDTVFVTLSVRGKGQPLTFTEGNAYAIAPQSLDGSQPLAAPETVTDTPNEDGTVTLSFPLPEGDSTFLFRATVSRPTP